MVGQDEVVRSLKQVLKDKGKRAFLFHGPSGTGKTTIARIIAAQLECEHIIEVDGATYSGVEPMRELTRSLQYCAVGANPSKVVILDEVHRVSAAAWDSLLKSVEEPPKHVTWCLCTTEFTKVPKTIQTRCVCYLLSPVGRDTLYDFLIKIADAEKLSTPDDVIYLVAEKAGGSPRQALSYLAQVHGCVDRIEAAALLHEAQEDDDAIRDLCEGLLQQMDWKKAQDHIKALEGLNAESIRLSCMAYLTKVLQNSGGSDKAVRVLNIMRSFYQPWPSTPMAYPLIMTLAELVFEQN